jgi:hypothetical protein
MNFPYTTNIKKIRKEKTNIKIKNRRSIEILNNLVGIIRNKEALMMKANKYKEQLWRVWSNKRK